MPAPCTDNGDSVSMGFALYDHRSGPTPEEARIMDNIDGLSAFLRNQMMGCEKIRTPLTQTAVPSPLSREMGRARLSWIETGRCKHQRGAAERPRRHARSLPRVCTDDIPICEQCLPPKPPEQTDRFVNGSNT